MRKPGPTRSLSAGKTSTIRLLIAAFSRCCPRVLTIVVLAAIAALLVLANLSEDFSPRSVAPGAPPAKIGLDFDPRVAVGNWQTGAIYWNLSYGWPLIWRQYVFAAGLTGGVVLGENYSAGRLAGNVAIWLVLFIAPTGACEWLLRRYRPRWRFSLRATLVGTGLAAALCAWFVAARNRANVQDRIINGQCRQAWVERSGPDWLRNVGADRLCRRMVGIQIDWRNREENRHHELAMLLGELRRLPDVRYLSLTEDRLTPQMASALSQLVQLETLEIDIGDLSSVSGEALGGLRGLKSLSVGRHAFGMRPIDEFAIPRNCLAAIGKMSQLEHLYLIGRTVDAEDLSLLAGLKNLRSLALDGIYCRSDRPSANRPFLWRLPALPQLETLDLSSRDADDRDLSRIAALPRLKSLNLTHTGVSGTGLAELAPLASLEELAIDADGESSAGLEALVKLNRLKKLHIDRFDEGAWKSRDALREALPADLQNAEIDASLRAMAALRKSHRELLIDGKAERFYLSQPLTPNCETAAARMYLPGIEQALRTWKEQQAATAANAGIVDPLLAN